MPVANQRSALASVQAAFIHQMLLEQTPTLFKRGLSGEQLLVEVLDNRVMVCASVHDLLELLGGCAIVDRRLEFAVEYENFMHAEQAFLIPVHAVLTAALVGD